MGININGFNQTNIILIALYITYSVLSWFPPHSLLYVSLARNQIGITKHNHFLMRGLWSSLWKRHILRTTTILKDGMGNVPEKQYSLEYQFNSNSKPISLSTISLTLELSSWSVIAPGMQNNDSTMLFFIFVL